MTTRRMDARRVDEEGVNEEVPPHGGQFAQGVQVLQVGNQVLVVSPDMTNGEIREALLALARAMTAQVNRNVEPRVNAFESTMTYRMRDFVRVNPPFFPGSKGGRRPQ